MRAQKYVKIGYLPAKREMGSQLIRYQLCDFREGRDYLFFPGHHARQGHHEVMGVHLESFADQALGFTGKNQDGGFFDDVGYHDNGEVVTFPFAQVLGGGKDFLLAVFGLALVHDRALADADAVMGNQEFLHVVLDDFVRAHVVDVRTGLEHLHPVGLDVDTGYFRKVLGHVLVVLRAGGGLEEHGVGKDGREHQACDLGRNGHLPVDMHVGYDGAGAAHWVLARENRFVGLDSSQTMMVDDFEDLRLFNAFDGLAAFVVVYQNQFGLFRNHDAFAADHSDQFPVFFHRIIAVLVLFHAALDVDQHVGGLEADHLGLHDFGDGYALVDETGASVCVVRTGEYRDFLAFGRVDDLGVEVPVPGDDQAGDTGFDASQHQVGDAVANQDDIPFFDKLLYRLQAACGNADVPVDFLVFLAFHNRHGIDDVGQFAQAYRGVQETLHAQVLEITLGHVAHGDDAPQVLCLVDDRDGLDIAVPHQGGQFAEVLVLVDGDGAVGGHVRHAGIDVGEQQGWFGLEVVEGEKGFLVEFPGPGRNHVHA